MRISSVLRFDDVYKSYPGAQPVHALSGVSFNVRRGSFAVIQGPSGSGKTTLLALAGGLDRPTSGRIKAFGWQLNALSEPALLAFRRAEVGFVFQDFKLIDVLTAWENVAVALQVRGLRRSTVRSRSRDLLAQLGLADRAAGFPTELSGGEKQRVAIARALVSDPRLILADEPTANLDWSIGAEVVGLLRKLAKQRGTTVLVVSHDPRLTDYADEVFQLIDGRITTTRALEVVA